jgi:hypothetical protein
MNNLIIKSNNLIIKSNKVIRHEIYYQGILENVMLGTHKKLPCGITDITTHDTHAEIKKWNKWKEAIGQLLSYNTFDYKPNLQIYLFHNYLHTKKLNAIKVFNKYDITPFEFLCDEDKGKLLIINLLNNKCIFKDDLKN